MQCISSYDIRDGPIPVTCRLPGSLLVLDLHLVLLHLIYSLSSPLPYLHRIPFPSPLLYNPSPLQGSATPLAPRFIHTHTHLLRRRPFGN